jgi:Fe-S-cluster containining protein
MSAWYADGLKFECTQCGKCCGGAPGTVLVTDSELKSMSQALQLSPEQFREMYTRTLPSGKLSLRERANYDCVFFERDLGCTIYAQRPQQCRTWPFWRGNLASREHWEASSLECPGMDQGPVHSAEQIRSVAAQDGTSGFVPKPAPKAGK